MRKNFNVVVPTIKANYLLHNCVKKLELQTYKNFILTIVLEKKDGLFEFKNYLNKTNLSYNIIISTEKNISRKRNIGVNSSPSKYIAFIDSDAYPDPKWLEVGFKYLSQKKYLIIGGPSGIPYQNESEHFLISNYAKRSFFCNGNLAKRKYSKKNCYLSWLESCNLMMENSLYKSIGGMNESLYVGEDLELCKKINKKFGSNKIFYIGDMIVHHKDRSVINFLKQRFVYGLNLDKILKNLSLFGKFISLIPTFFSLTLIFSFFQYNQQKFFYFSIAFFFVILFFFINIEFKKFRLKFRFFIKVFFLILFANMFYFFGNVLSFFGLGRFLSHKIYSNSQS